LRPLWSHYLKDANGVIFVVDSSDAERLDIARQEMENILSDIKAPPGMPLLVLANKQDMKPCLSVEDIEQRLRLRAYEDRKWGIFGCIAISPTDHGLLDGIEWLVDKLQPNKKKKRQRYQKKKKEILRKAKGKDFLF